MGKGEGSGEGWGEGEGQGVGDGTGAGEWKHGLFGCMDDGGNCKLNPQIFLKVAFCLTQLFYENLINLLSTNYFSRLGLCGWCCGLCLLCQNANKMGESPALYCILSCIAPCIPLFLLRQKLRERNGIDGETSHDAIAACCCACCVNVQIANELDG